MSSISELVVDRTISPNDGMLGGNERHYFSVGASALANIERIIDPNVEKSAPPSRILDLPCGHGRVLRYLRAAYSTAEITACDLLKDGVDFCASRFGAIPVYSDPDPAKIQLAPDSFDLIWVGSLFTHLDKPDWHRFLTVMRDWLKPGGRLIITTSGRQAHHYLASRAWPYDLDDRGRRDMLRQYRETGFGFIDYPGSVGYGVSFSHPQWVCGLLMSVPELRLVSLSEKSWDNHLDVFGCVRDVAWKADCMLPLVPDHSRKPTTASGLPRKIASGWKRWWSRSA